MSEKIIRIELYKCPVKLKEPFVISLGKLEFADNVVVVVRTSGGITGFGECSPFQTIHGENSDTCIIVGKIIAERLLGKNALDTQECSALMDSVIQGNTSIKSGFDIALFDINAQHANQPLWKFLGGKNNRELFTDYTVSIGPADKMADDALKILKNGFPVIKVKLGGKKEEDYHRMKAIRSKVGNEIPIRIDANQGWSKEDAIDILKRLNEFDIQHCEEPISRKNFLKLPEIKSQSPIPIMADESCFDHVDAQNLVDINACDLLNVKLGKSSGITKARKIISIAEKAGMTMQAGGFLESRLGFTAAAHVALSSENFKYIDFDTPLMFEHDPVEGGISYHPGGRIKVPELRGLGAIIPDRVLKSMEGILIQ